VKKIGIIADESSETKARVLLIKDMENFIKAEDIVLVLNGSEEKPVCKILGILRKGQGKNELLNSSRYRPEVAYAKIGGEPSSSREIFSFEVIPIGSFQGNEKLTSNRLIIQPRSPVYIFDEEENPLDLIKNSCKQLSFLDAYLEGHPKWQIPADAFYIPYHVGVFGTTGTGKSWFTRNVLIPFYIKNGYDVLVLDWSGRDYVPFFPNNTIDISQIAKEENAIMEYFSELTDNFFGQNNLRYAFEEYVTGWKNKIYGKSPEQVHNELNQHLQNYIKENVERRDVQAANRRAAERSMKRITTEQIRYLMGDVEIEEILNSLREKKIEVLNLAGYSSNLKLSLFLTLSRKLSDLMYKGQNLNLALVIDEAPQYCPYKPEGILERVTEEIKNLAALGRKHNLNLTLISQGIAGEIGINAAVRRNLNTNFYGRLHPLDAASEGGAKDWLQPYGISADYLLTLEDGRFYFSGVMNPCPVPLLITYEPKDGGN